LLAADFSLVGDVNKYDTDVQCGSRHASSAESAESSVTPLLVCTQMLTDVTAVKRSYDGSSSPEMLSKKMRTQTFPATGGRTMAPGDARSPGRYSIGGDSRPLMNNSAFTERPPAPPLAVGAVETGSMPKLSSFRPEAVGPQGVPVIPITPARPTTRRPSAIERDESPEPAETPIYARSLHLVDIGVSIYKKIHGDESSECPLCLYCFRQHGAFNRINQHGYEVCGSDEALDSHYWEPYGDTEDCSER
jgi:hypothetical protein